MCAVVADGEEGSDDPWSGPSPFTCSSQHKEKSVTTQSLLKCPRCASICLQVMRVCPYLAPDRYQVDSEGRTGLHASQYGGHPAFYCPGHVDREPSETPPLFSSSSSSCPRALEQVQNFCGHTGSDSSHGSNSGYDQYGSLLDSTRQSSQSSSLSSYVPRPPQSFPVVQDDRTIYYYNYNHLSKRKSPARSFRDLYSLLHSRPEEEEDDDYDDYDGTYEDFSNNNNNEFSNNDNKYVYSYDTSASNLLVHNNDGDDKASEPPYFTSCCWQYYYSTVDTKEYGVDTNGYYSEEPSTIFSSTHFNSKGEEDVVNYQCCNSIAECSMKDPSVGATTTTTMKKDSSSSEPYGVGSNKQFRAGRRSAVSVDGKMDSKGKSSTVLRGDIKSSTVSSDSSLRHQSVTSGGGKTGSTSGVLLMCVSFLLVPTGLAIVVECYCGTAEELFRLGGVVLPPILRVVLILSNLLLRLLILLFLLVVKLLLFKSLLFLWRRGGMQKMLWTRNTCTIDTTTSSVVNSTDFLPNRVVIEPLSKEALLVNICSSWRRRRRRSSSFEIKQQYLDEESRKSLLEWPVVNYDSSARRGQFLLANNYNKNCVGRFIHEKVYGSCNSSGQVYLDLLRVQSGTVIKMGKPKFPWAILCLLLPVSFKCLQLFSRHKTMLIVGMNFTWFLGGKRFQSMRLHCHHRSSFFSPRSISCQPKFSHDSIYFIFLSYSTRKIIVNSVEHIIFCTYYAFNSLVLLVSVSLLFLLFLAIIIISVNDTFFLLKCGQPRHGASAVSCQFCPRAKLTYIASINHSLINNKHSCL